MNNFDLIYQSKECKARLGRIVSLNGEVLTPAFFPVATQAAVKTLSPKDLNSCGVQGLLSNIYHLYLRPGIDVIEGLGGLRKFMGWKKPVITDSGGYQIFSLAKLIKVYKEGVEFNSHIDGSRHFLKPEDIIRMQFRVRSSVVLPLDECLKFPVTLKYAEDSLALTNHWAKLSQQAFKECLEKFAYSPLPLGIIQGSIYPELRKKSLEFLIGTGYDHFAIGGLSVGESKDLRYNIIDFLSGNFSEGSLRYVMGIGEPEDILELVDRGMDLFDCVIPTRLGRTGTAFTDKGKIVVRNSAFRKDSMPLDEGCGCYACRNFSRGYIRHLINANEVLGGKLISFHNIWWFMEFMKRIRREIKKGSFRKFKKDFLAGYFENSAVLDSDKDDG